MATGLLLVGVSGLCLGLGSGAGLQTRNHKPATAPVWCLMPHSHCPPGCCRRLGALQQQGLGPLWLLGRCCVPGLVVGALGHIGFWPKWKCGSLVGGGDRKVDGGGGGGGGGDGSGGAYIMRHSGPMGWLW